jgi:hypothetical protein
MNSSLKQHSIKSILFFFTACLICNLLACVNAKLSFERFEEIERVDTTQSKGVQIIKKEEYYLVTGYKRNKKVDAQIDSFFCTVKDFNQKYYTHWIHFLRKSKETSKEYFREYERGFFMHLGLQDRIVSYKIDNRQHRNITGFECYKEICKGKQYPVKTEKFECK